MIAIDKCYLDLIFGLIRSQKPSSVLELGFGTGSSTRTILKALDFNEKGNLTLVENFHDWNFDSGNVPIPNGVKLIKISEKEFINTYTLSFDFILSDADHFLGDLNILKFLNLGGILVAHDITNDEFPALHHLKKLSPIIFNESSADYEKCSRGLLVFKAA